MRSDDRIAEATKNKYIAAIVYKFIFSFLLLFDINERKYIKVKILFFAFFSFFGYLFLFLF